MRKIISRLMLFALIAIVVIGCKYTDFPPTKDEPIPPGSGCASAVAFPIAAVSVIALRRKNG
jgi:hypothetical protein